MGRERNDAPGPSISNALWSAVRKIDVFGVRRTVIKGVLANSKTSPMESSLTDKLVPHSPSLTKEVRNQRVYKLDRLGEMLHPVSESSKRRGPNSLFHCNPERKWGA